MSDLKALTSSASGIGGIGGSDDDDMSISTNSKGISFSGWISKFGARTQRRGSLGFSDSHIGTPPARFDEDSNSGFAEDKVVNGLSRKRNDSSSELHGMTPGDDGDLYFLRNKFRRNDSDNNLQEVVQSSIHITTDGLLKMEIAKHAEPHKETPMPTSILPILEEGRVLSSSPRRRTEEMNSFKRKDEDKEGSLFLIDLEEVEQNESGRKILKPSSRKFSASSLLQSKFAQNWFFKNGEDEDDDTNRLVSEEGEHTFDKNDTQDKSMLSRLKTIVEKTPAKHREMNVWQPQGT